MTVSPRTQALRYRIWAYANPRGWDVTMQDIADALGETREEISSCIAKTPRWGGRGRWTSTPRWGGRGRWTSDSTSHSFGEVAPVGAGKLGHYVYADYRGRSHWQ